MTLYELSAEMAGYINAYDAAETEEERAEIAQSLVDLHGEITDKADGYAKVMRNKMAEAEALKNEAKRLTDKANAAENLAERLKNVMFDAMKLTGQTEIPTSIGKWRVQNNPWSCEVVDIDKVPMQYHIKQEDKIDKAELLKQFASTGEVVDGCEFVQKQGIRFR